MRRDPLLRYDNDDYLKSKGSEGENTREANIQLKLGDVSSLDLLRTRGTPQNHAFSWLVDQDEHGIDQDEHNLTQRYILALLYYSLGGADWHHHDIFLLHDKHECEWISLFGGHRQVGVLECNEEKEVTNLFLVDNNLVGSLPSEIAYLSKLTNLDFQHNRLQGQMPEGLGYLTKLEYLGLSKNQFEGTVPKTLGGIDSLEQFLVNENSLEGSIPESICKLKTRGVFYNLWADCNGLVCECCTVCCDENHKCGNKKVGR